jgi:hypothetical protein
MAVEQGDMNGVGKRLGQAGRQLEAAEPSA